MYKSFRARNKLKMLKPRQAVGGGHCLIFFFKIAISNKFASMMHAQYTI